MLTRKAMIMVLIGVVLTAGIALARKAPKQTAADTETAASEQKWVRPARVDWLAQLREAYDNNDREAMGNIIEQMEQHRDQMLQRREQFMEKMKNFDPNDPNFPAGRGMRHPGARRWNRTGPRDEGFRQGKQWKDGKGGLGCSEPCSVPPEGCPLKHRKARGVPRPQAPEIDEEIIEQ
ncbi:MAG: hypothetical protein WCZ89_04850 [Phycisphaerae bacterium]